MFALKSCQMYLAVLERMEDGMAIIEVYFEDIHVFLDVLSNHHDINMSLRTLKVSVFSAMLLCFDLQLSTTEQTHHHYSECHKNIFLKAIIIM